jgi:alpha-tubulin suppressor-like RCC1 family protein
MGSADRLGCYRRVMWRAMVKRLRLGCGVGLAMVVSMVQADSSGPALASYYERHMALRDGVAYGWSGRDAPRALRRGVTQVGVGRDAFFGLLADGTLLAWTDDPKAARVLMGGVARFAAGASGWFAIDRGGVLWHGQGEAAPTRIAADVVDACIGDSADYFVTRDGALHVKGLAHRGQYGDGRLSATPGFVPTARDVAAVRAHTGHAIHLRRDGAVLGTGGNRFGPLSYHGLGDKADRWGPIFSGAVAIATGSRHSLAIRADGSLWAWGEGFAVEPSKVMERIVAVAAGDTATIALTADGVLWQWDGGGQPRRLAWP